LHCAVAALLMPACLPVYCWSFGTGQQPAGTATPSQPAAKAEPSQQALILVNQGNGLLDHNDFAGAVAVFQKAIQENPSFAAARRGLGIALWRQGELDRAWQEMSMVACLEPESARAHYELGRLAGAIADGPANSAATDTALSAGDLRSIALSEVQKASSLAPRDFNMRLELSQLELAAGRKKDAQADALGAIALAPTAAERALAHVALARAFASTGDEIRAEAEYKKAIQENPSSGAAWLGLGEMALVQQNIAQAAADFNRAVQQAPDFGPAYAALAQLYIQAHRRTEALPMLQKAVALDPGDWQSQYELGKLLMEAGESAKAKELFTKVLAARPDFLAAGEQLALMRLRQGDVRGAMERAQQLLARGPRAVEGHRVLALVYWRERQTDNALAECAQALAVDPHSTSMLALQSLVLWQTKRRKDARRVLLEVARSDPSILSPVVFCRQIVCGAADVTLVGEFLHQNRWILAPPDPQ
ncbi:MAG TPA: tetratricopeptide repeat protein, partial [Terriglobia bacterium]|nr:tetratricopeptide repeat protein [Terriglobia bacterium]